MPREMFPIKKLGDGLGYQHVNDLGRVVSNLSGGNQGSGLQGSHGWITGQAGQVGPFFKPAKIREETDDDGIYTIRFRYWDESSGRWKDEDDDYEMDARCFTCDPDSGEQRAPALVYGDQLTVRYDGQRGLWLPCQFLFPDSRWAWVETAIAARSGAAEYSEEVKLVRQTLNSAGDEIAWEYLKDADDALINVRCFNGFPDQIDAEMHVRVGWNSLGQYEVKGVPCSTDASL